MRRARAPGALGRAALAVLLLSSLASAAAGQSYFWDLPTTITPGFGRFPRIAAAKGFLAAAWQETSYGADGIGTLQLRLATATLQGNGALQWGSPLPVGGPIRVFSPEPIAFTLCAGPAGELVVAGRSDEGIRILKSADRGATWAAAAAPTVENLSSYPQVYRSSGGYSLFAGQGYDKPVKFADGSTGSITEYRILLSTSADGLSWTAFRPLLPPAADFSYSFQPALASVGGSDIVVFQSQVKSSSGDGRLTYQLYLTRSADRGASWSAPALLTGFAEEGASGDLADPTAYSNESPSLATDGKRLLLAWTRSPPGSPAEAWALQLAASGSAAAAAERASPPGTVPAQPQAFFLPGGQAGLVCTDTARDAQRPAAYVRGDGGWEELPLGSVSGRCSFPGEASLSDTPCFLWQKQAGGKTVVSAIAPDRTVRAPSLSAANFQPGRANAGNQASFRWTAPEDPAGIRGFSYSWSQDAGATPPTPDEAPLSAGFTSIDRTAGRDGSWYFSLRVQDNAGNWSAPVSLEYRRDTAAPQPPRILPPPLGADGSLASNTFTLSWTQPQDADVAGYTWNLRPAPAELAPAPGYPRRVLGTGTEASWNNIQNGEWLFEVAAIDQAGNISEPARLKFSASHFVPYTLVTQVETSQDQSGAVRMRIFGRGFTDDGTVQRVILDKDGVEPWDRSWDLASGGFSVENNDLIDGIKVSDLQAGSYRLFLVHPSRGTYLAPERVRVEQGGTVKYGDRPSTWKEGIVAAPRGISALAPWTALAAALLALALASVLALSRRVVLVLEDGRLVRAEALALIQGDIMPTAEDKRRLRVLARRGAGLRLKFSLFVAALIILVVSTVAFPLGLYSLQRQSYQQASSLQERAGILLESLTSSARINLSDQSTSYVLLGDSMNSLSAMKDEALWAAITQDGGGPSKPELLAATSLSDADFSNAKADSAMPKIDTPTRVWGSTAFTDSLSPSLPGIVGKVMQATSSPEIAARRQVLDDIEARVSLAMKRGDTKAASEIQKELKAPEDDLAARLATVANELSGSYPRFDPNSLNPGQDRYLFYKPILLYQKGHADYYLGMVRLDVSTKVIRANIDALRMGLLSIALTIALLSILLGLAGAVFFATTVTRPIKRLVKAFEVVRDTAKKEKLGALRVSLASHDELRTLSDTFNTMVKGLVHGAKDNADLMAGEQDQRELLPLESDARRKKLAVGALKTPALEFFAYYKGAKLVSGDYVDYRSLDGRHYAFIKCDVSGKGVSAAMIMAIVASVFKGYFEGWSASAPGFNLPELCYRINGTLNACEFRGKFAAFTVGIFDSATGKVWLAHAGDSLYRVYEAATGKLVTRKMEGDAPAAGPIPTFMVEARTPFRQTSFSIGKGDVLVLFSDGIDEARRYWRDAGYERIRMSSGSAAPAQTGEHAGQAEEFEFEDFSNDRAAAVFEAALQRSSYRLVREHDPVPGQAFDFDFSACDGGIEDGVMALVAVEKVFRFYRPPHAQDDDQVKVDARVDGFLRKTLKQYFDWCALKAENPEEKEEEQEEEEGKGKRPQQPSPAPGASVPAHYIMYRKLMEDEQYDDITILALKRL